MKVIAYILLIHEKTDHLMKLIYHLNDGINFIFIHLDKKSEVILEEFVDSNNIFFVKDNIEVYWGGSTIMEATLKTLTLAYNSCNAESFIFISGNDYPLHSQQYIRDFLLQNNFDYIDSKQMTDVKRKIGTRRKVYKMDSTDRVKFFFFPKLDRRNMTLHKFFIILLEEIISIFYEKKIDYNLYYGSSWWILKRDTVSEVLNEINVNYTKYHCFFSSHGPDESFFQTILSELGLIEDSYSNKTYTIWKKGRPSPELISIKDIEYLENDRSWLFARKFPGNDIDILNHLEKRLWNKEKDF